MERSLYVYYRIDAASLHAAAAVVRAAQAALCAAHPGLQATLLRRPGEAGGDVTLMETYALPGGIGAPLQAGIDAALAAITPYLRGPRFTEVFVPVD